MNIKEALALLQNEGLQKLYAIVQGVGGKRNEELRELTDEITSIYLRAARTLREEYDDCE